MLECLQTSEPTPVDRAKGRLTKAYAAYYTAPARTPFAKRVELAEECGAAIDELADAFREGASG